MDIQKIYRLKTQKKLFSFEDPIGQVPIMAKTLWQWQQEITSKAGLKLVEVDNESEISDPAFLVFEENLFFSFEFLKKILNTVEKNRWPMQFCTASNRFNRRFSLPNDDPKESLRRYNFFYKTKENTKPKCEIISQKIYKTSLKLPFQLLKTGELDYDQCDTYITSILSPFHLLFANLYMLVSHRLVKYRKLIPDKLQSRIHDRSPAFFRFLRIINKIGKKCKIHPTAVIEGCIVGDGVIIGANAVVRLSYIGDDCIIEDQCTVLYSVIGAKSCISHNNLIVATMCYEEVYLIHGPYQFSIYGKNTAVFATINCDIRLDQKTIRILTDKGLMDSRQQLLGIAFGHRSIVGGGNVIAPGRIVPNDFWISSPASIVSQFPKENNLNVNKEAIDWY